MTAIHAAQQQLGMPLTVNGSFQGTAQAFQASLSSQPWLIGIVKKNAIMMIDFALVAERHGASPHDAIRQACELRFRPIMMTTLAALLGALPLALGHGAGAELRVPLGVSIVGGLIVSQILTLYTTPVIYLMFDRFAKREHGVLALPDEDAARA